MKLTFEDNSYLDIKESGDDIVIIISAKDYDNYKKKITNSVKISKEEFKKILESINIK